MILIGLTGSIGMGKSTTAGMFAARGVAAYDADAAVHALYAAGGAAVAPIEARFPGTVVGSAVDRGRLGERVRGDATAFRDLEAIVHPLVAAAQSEFLRGEAEGGAAAVVLDIPLLFETGGHTRVDAVVLATAPAAVQRERVLARPGMTAEAFEVILARQMADVEKRARSDFLVDTSTGFTAAEATVDRIVAAVTYYRPLAWGSRQSGASFYA